MLHAQLRLVIRRMDRKTFDSAPDGIQIGQELLDRVPLGHHVATTLGRRPLALVDVGTVREDLFERLAVVLNPVLRVVLETVLVSLTTGN